ncbi:MAG: aminotransferase class III-fold pyridoxal phosphate-dependent enzyme [Paenibacillaceae bacterium]|nr:aminotransferase class III-fold pyridoxal phosphate-dependent enzyme [Paenibacillaceae bacterium]
MIKELEQTEVLKVADELKDIIHMISGMEKEAMDIDRRLISYGLDSILLLTLSKQIDSIYQLVIPLDIFFTTLNTLRLVAEHIVINSSMVQEETQEIDSVESEMLPAIDSSLNSNSLDFGNLVKIFDSQYHIIMKQNEILKLITEPNKKKEPEAVKPAQKQKPQPGRQTAAQRVDYFVPYRKMELHQEDEVPPLQLAYIKNIEQRVNNLTKTSKEQTQKYRHVYASNRNSAGFRLLYKEMLYQIIADQGRGDKLVDLDGNEMIDLTMGFGALLFGHNPDFVKKALLAELEKGMPLGPMGRLTGEVASDIAQLTGVERVFFCNSGTEADMFAVRVARAVTGKNKVVCFKGAFHGTYDGVLGIPMPTDDPDLNTISLTPGITDNSVRDLILLDYDSEDSLRYIESHADIIAAVLTEPVQSRRPDLQPGPFLKKLRAVTEQCNIALIFDEIITGFRICTGGAQEYFGVKADIVTYGKVIGGGMPIGILAGKREYLDSIDGGMWKFGDNSVPPCDDKRTFVAGTFCHHPLAMTAAHAVLQFIKENKAQIYDNLNQKTAEMVTELNEFFDLEKVPVHINHFSSLFRFNINLEKEIFYYGLLEKGIYVWEGRNCFLSTEHSNEDIQYIINAVKKTINEMKDAGFFQ